MTEDHENGGVVEVSVRVTYEPGAPMDRHGISSNANVLVDEIYYIRGDDPLTAAARDLRSMARAVEAAS